MSRKPFDATPPDTVHAVLVCANEHRARPHSFAHKAPVTIGPRRRIIRVQLIYECDACGTTRAWGAEVPFPHAPPPPHVPDAHTEARAS